MDISTGNSLRYAALTRMNELDRFVYADWLEEYNQPGADLWHSVSAPVPNSNRIDSITEEQYTLLLPVIRDHWLQVGTATGPVNEDEVPALVAEVYKMANLPPPEIFIWLNSPLAGVIGSYLLQNTTDGNLVTNQVSNQLSSQVRSQIDDQVSSQAEAQIWNQVWNQIGNQIRYQVSKQIHISISDTYNQVSEQVWNEVNNQVCDQVCDQVSDLVWDQVTNQVRNQVWNQICDQVIDQLNDQVSNQVSNQIYLCVYGQHDAAWLSFYATMYLLGLECVGNLIPLMTLAHYVGWWWAFDKVVILTRRPSELVTEKRKLVSITYPDGWTVKP